LLAPALLATVAAFYAPGSEVSPADAQAPCKEMRKVKLGVSVAPPNVVHTPPYVAKALGIFAKRCIDAEIIEFEGGLSATNLTAVARGDAMASMNATAIAQGLKAKQIWGMAPRLPQAYVVSEDVKTTADLKGKRLSAVGGGAGGFNWVMGREVLKIAGLKVDDVQFISGATAGRVPGLIQGQINGVALHPEDVFLAQKQKPGVKVLVVLAELLPKYFFNAYGAATDWITKDRALARDVAASLIEANRVIYRQKDKVLPVMVEATKKPPEAVSFAYDYLTRNCVWSVNTGFSKERTEWSIGNAIENGDIKPEKRPSYEQVVDVTLGDEALASAGGATKIGNCAD
jgi:ABC-type nitrate/sulfonate/bicarbonate transport system substrate-binding protein